MWRGRTVWTAILKRTCDSREYYHHKRMPVYTAPEMEIRWLNISKPITVLVNVKLNVANQLTFRFIDHRQRYFEIIFADGC